MPAAPTIRELLEKVTFRRIDVDQVLDPAKPSWIKFDPELGYVPNDIVMLDGTDHSKATYTHGRFGERRVMNYAELPCRINTYGDSFTQCQQVSDNETWQERLAAHIGEPIRNFGSGGYSVYCAYNRLMRTEQTGAAAEYLIVNCFADDHLRNLDAARWIRTAWNERDRPADKAYPLHGLPWAHVRYDVNTRRFGRQEGKCRNEQDLIALTDKETFYETFKDDQVVRLFILELGGEARVDDLEAMAEDFGLKVNLRDPNRRKDDAFLLHRVYGIKASHYIFDQLVPWCEANKRKLLVLTSYCMGTLHAGMVGAERYDQAFVDYLDAKGIRWVDMLKKHVEDYRQFNLKPEQYLERYFIQAKGAAVFGHYNPMANMFYAFAIKDAIVDWLDPKPPAYR